MRKIFYNEETLEIKGMSDGENSMDFPYIEVEEDYHSTYNFYLERGESGEVELKFYKGTL